MDQAYRLLRATCVYCHSFRIPPTVLHRFVCQLRLLQYGLAAEAHIVGSLGDNDWALEFEDELGLPAQEAEEENSSIDPIVRRRDEYVSRCIRGIKLNKGDTRRGKHEGAGQMRRDVIKEFLAEILKKRECSTCNGISPAYRKDRFVKVFEKALSAKEKVKMAARSLSFGDALAKTKKQTKPREDADADEGVADVNSVQSDSGGEMDVDSADEAIKDEAVKDDRLASQRFITAMEVQARLTELFRKEQEVLFLLYNSKPRTRFSKPVTSDSFFMSTILVPPNRFRPESRQEDELNEAQQNNLYRMMLKASSKIARFHSAVKEGRGSMTQLHEAWVELQEAANSLVDKNQNPVRGAAAAQNEDGIKQKLEKKEGLFRKNMMGKRVNYAARSVISPDPNIETNEIGVPPVFATKLTYPEPVTSHNFRELQQAVINGATKWPGAVSIEDESGRIVRLDRKSADERVALANSLLAPSNTNAVKWRNKKVYRHLTSGDVVLMNRQPTLHKPSIMGHRVRVLTGEKTIRMHYANCNTYNADFDGDEMNMHFPQNELARAEALNIADTDHQYLSATAGSPLRGLIQDHISVAVALCNRDTVLSRGDYHQLVYAALRPESGHIEGEKLQLLTPAIIKPVPRWTGKQVITTILFNIQPVDCGGLTTRGNTTLKAEQWGKDSEEGQVLILNGELITGILDKSQIGHSSGGLIHSVHEVYGAEVAGRLLSSLGRLLTRYLAMRAFSCGMEDLRLTAAGDKARKEALKAASGAGLRVAANYVSIENASNPRDPLLLERLEEVLRDEKKQEGLDLLTNADTKDITDNVHTACMPHGLEKQFPRNQMQIMTTSGAKGSRVNASLISCNLGQQVLEGRRVPVMVSGKTLPCFNPFETNIRAGGYIVNRFLTGIRPQEYYFHHMAGREGLIDTAVKTSRSGYLQRCIIKGMEGLSIGYDTTVRDADGSLIQFIYGEDGLDPTKQKYLSDFKFVLENVRSEATQLNYDAKVGAQLGANREAFLKYMKSALKHAKIGDPRSKDPLLSLQNPATNAFVTSEKFYQAMTSYIKENKDGLIREKGDKTTQGTASAPALNRKNAEMLFAMKYLKSLVEPGEAVGIVAGQSIGEPSTQMTLNTFHLAGHSAKNVTLGIPRLREILMTASTKPSTPAMTLQPLKELPEEEAEKFTKSISALPLANLLDHVTVEEKVGRGVMYPNAKIYQINLKFFPWSEYTQAYAIRETKIMDAIENKLLRHIVALTKREIKLKKSKESQATPVIGAKAGVIETAATTAAENVADDSGADDDDDDDDAGDGDATSAKQRANRSGLVSYGPNDDEDDAVIRRIDREQEEDELDEGLGSSPPPTAGMPSESNGLPDGDGSDVEMDADPTSSSARSERIKEKYGEVTHFEGDEFKAEWCRATLEYDAATPKVLMLNIVQAAVARTLVQEVRGIKGCSFVKGEIHVDGSNLKAMQQFGQYIDPNRISTNDISSIGGAYGVEAARATIVNELFAVFDGHGIKVDMRHLNLIGDFMTRNGGFTPFNRNGLKGNVSPFTKASFETTLQVLKEAVLEGDWDDLITPSSRLVMGRLGKVGTGGFDVLTRLPTYHVGALA